MSAALERVCSELKLRPSDRKNDSIIEDIADKINRLAQRGITNEADCYRAVMGELAQELRKENERLLRLVLKLTEKMDALQEQGRS
jgi:hypothetical protein